MISETDLYEMFGWMADLHLAYARDAVQVAARRGLAPLAIGSFGAVASAAAGDLGDPRAEVALISASVGGFALAADTPVDDVLRFRDAHVAEIGRFRASLIDLAAVMNRGASATAMAEEAHSLVRNRVRPSLSELESVLKASRLNFALRTLTGAVGVATGPVTRS